MGMFDREPNLSNEEWAFDDAGFQLLSGEYLGMHKSADYGENQKARVTVRTPENEDKAFTVWGVLADQISRMADGDLPTAVKIEKDGRANVFVQVEQG